MKTKLLLPLLLFLYILLAVWYSFYIISPPPVKPVSAPSSEFSAERAFEHVQNLATESRTLGTAANDSARMYLTDQLRQLGLEPTIQEGVGVSARYSVAGYVRNILAELPGSNPQKTILLMAHYDSVPSGPGAGDDASGVAVILEVLRAVTSATPPRHNIQVLFTDGEERGLLGAELYADRYPTGNPVDLVINVESRGSAGSSIMFESSSNNSALIPHFARATSYPVANSLTYTVYELMPNDTDLTATKRIGLAGLNYAIIDEFLNYHTQLDNIENLSLQSLQHHGENLLSNVLYFGNNTYDLEGDQDYVYFNNFTGGIAYFPASWSFPLALALALMLIGYMILQFKRGSLQLLHYILSVFGFILLLGLGSVLTHYGWQFIQWLHPQYQWLVQGETYNHAWYLIGFSALTLALALASASWLIRRLSINNLMAGIYSLWVLLGGITAWYLPTASYLLTLPALFALPGWIYLKFHTDLHWDWKTYLILCLSLFPALFMIPPYIKLVHITMTTNLMAINMILLLLLIGLCLPLLWQIIRLHPLYWSAGLTLVFLICIAGAALNASFDANHKKQNNIMYLSDLDTGRAYWASRDHTTDSWTDQFLGEHPSEGSPAFPIKIFGLKELLYAEAPQMPFREARLEITTDSSDGTLRYLNMRIHNPEQSTGMHMRLTDGQLFREIYIFGKNLGESLEMGKQTSFRQFFFFADLTNPVDLRVVLPNNNKIGLEISYFNHTLPTQLIKGYRPREQHMMPIPGDLADVTIWKRTYWLDSLSKETH